MFTMQSYKQNRYRNPAAHANGYFQGLTEKEYINIYTVGKCIDFELYRKQVT
jgi:hypothetical protein